MKYTIPFLLMICVFVTAMQVVIAQHDSRKLFVEIQGLEQTRDDLNEEWSRLLLEQSTWATDARIETIARNDLGMVSPEQDTKVLIVK